MIKRELVERFFSSDGVEHRTAQDAVRRQLRIDVSDTLQKHGVGEMNEEDIEGVIDSIGELYHLEEAFVRELQDAQTINEPVADSDIS